METVKRYVRGEHTGFEIRVHVAVLALGFWLLVLGAWLGYPSYNRYSITTDTLSKLGSFDPKKNPEWYWLFSAAMVYCGMVMIPVILYIRRRIEPISESGAKIGQFFFLIGCVAIALTGVFPDAHGHIVGEVQARDIHKVTAVTIAVAFGLGILWHGAMLIRDKFTNATFSDQGDAPYLMLTGPFLLCVPIVVAVVQKIQWEYVWAVVRGLPGLSEREIAAQMSMAVESLKSFPLLEHLAIWALTLFVMWFASVLPAEPDSRLY